MSDFDQQFWLVKVDKVCEQQKIALDAIYNNKWRPIFNIYHLRLDFDLHVVMYFAGHMLIGLLIGLSLVDNYMENPSCVPRRWYYQSRLWQSSMK
jgi:hypothetical protein